MCQDNPADKTNTHYLTDGVIRTCLNEEGVNIREKGLMFNISLDKNSIEAKFQRNTSQKAIKQMFGRDASDSEIDDAKKVPFSVDHFFCSACEKRFTEIEEYFLKEILPQLRGNDFDGKTEIVFDNLLVRKFFLLQIYRTAVCDPELKISTEMLEKLRLIILNAETDSEEVKSVPLNITYLNTVGDNYEYTKNTVGTASEGENRLILFNDFIIHFHESNDFPAFIDFWGLNEKDTFADFTNYQEENFKIKILNNKERLQFWNRYYKEKAHQQISFYRSKFTRSYIRMYGVPPHPSYLQKFVTAIIYGNDIKDEPRYSSAQFEKMLKLYLPIFKPIRSRRR